VEEAGNAPVSMLASSGSHTGCSLGTLGDKPWVLVNNATALGLEARHSV
jgi:hypothetical protein